MLEAKQTCCGFEVTAGWVIRVNQVLNVAKIEAVYVIALVVYHDARFVVITFGHGYSHCLIHANRLTACSVINLEEIIVF